MINKPDFLEFNASHPFTVGVVADTHIPDRVNCVHPHLLDGLRKKNVDVILHAGDFVSMGVMDDLNEIAPVFGVRGNRDFLLRKNLPITRIFMINNVRILLTHGHINAVIYWKDKAANFLRGYEFSRYQTRLSKVDPESCVYIFGHSHRAENTWQGGKLYFNPGGSSVGIKPDFKLSYGILQIHPDGKVDSEIVPLEGAVVKLGKWDLGERNKPQN